LCWAAGFSFLRGGGGGDRSGGLLPFLTSWFTAVLLCWGGCGGAVVVRC
ncbi:hypothetical protein A2U01_0075218, partial [Trifolium medium]|nr:hypothetical protein [Trifolium medium]